jgi:hypothetical protein
MVSGGALERVVCHHDQETTQPQALKFQSAGKLAGASPWGVAGMFAFDEYQR